MRPLVTTTTHTCLLLATVAAAGEHWAGLEGGGLRSNASATNVPPSSIKKVWHRTFPALPIGDQSGPNNEMDFAAGKGAWNLAVVDNKVALVATENPAVPNDVNDYYCVVLDADNGETVNWIQIKSSQGNTRAYRWPHYCVSASGDNISGIVQIAWDPQSRILFAAQGAYPSSYTAWLPLENAGSFESGKWQAGVPAYQALSREHPGFQDAFGRTRSEMMTVFGPDTKIDPMQPYTWGLSGFYTSKPETAEASPSNTTRTWKRSTADRDRRTTTRPPISNWMSRDR